MQPRVNRVVVVLGVVLGLGLGVLGACGTPPASTPPDAPTDVSDAPPDGSPFGDPFEALQKLPPICSVDQWCWRTPTPTGNEYHRIYATGPDNIWLVGQHGTVMQWNGFSWTAHRPAVAVGQSAVQYPMSISGRSGTDIWLIYGNAIVHWDGVAWTIRDPGPGGPVTLNSIWQAPNGDVWATQSNGMIRRSRGGGAFQEITAGCGTCYLGSIWGVAPDDFFITMLPAGILRSDGESFVRSYNGPFIAGSFMGRKDDVWVSGVDGGVLRWNGASWATASMTPPQWYVTGLAALAPDDVWWWASVSSSMVAFWHWNGTTLSKTPVDTAGAPALHAGAIVDGRWWLVGDTGSVYTTAAPGVLRPVVNPPLVRGVQGIWGSADDNLYFATGGEIWHWNGSMVRSIAIPANTISGVRRNGGDELFATGFELSADQTQYIANAFHYDGERWTKTQLAAGPLAAHRYFTAVHAMGPGKAMAVGYGGLAYHFAGGAWTPVATGVTTDLMGVWGPDADRVWMTGPGGRLLAWDSASPGVATADPSLPPTTDDLGPIHGADGITWIGLTNTTAVLRRDVSGSWTRVPSNVAARGLFAVSATNVVASSGSQSRLARWNGAQFVAEDTGSGIATPVLFHPPGGPMLAAGLWGIVQHP